MFCLLSMQIYLAPLCSSDVRVRRGLQRRLVAIVVSHLGGVSCLMECKSVDNIFPFLFCFYFFFAPGQSRPSRGESLRAAMLFICLAAATAAASTATAVAAFN